MRVKLLRIERGLTQKELCDLVKTSSKKIVDIERGNYGAVTIDLGKRIASVLGSSFEELFLREN